MVIFRSCLLLQKECFPVGGIVLLLENRDGIFMGVYRFKMPVSACMVVVVVRVYDKQRLVSQLTDDGVDIADPDAGIKQQRLFASDHQVHDIDAELLDCPDVFCRLL